MGFSREALSGLQTVPLNGSPATTVENGLSACSNGVLATGNAGIVHYHDRE
jgi:hypothetical protein